MNWVLETFILQMVITVVLNLIIFGIFKATHKED